MVALRRAVQRSRMVAIVLAVLTFLGTSGSWHADADDPDCAIDLIAHSHSAHHARLGTPAGPVSPVHCAICHWLQAFRSDAVRHMRVPLASDSCRRAFVTDIQAIRTETRIDLPSRAPPA
jgi:hypothetical protein